MSIGRFVVAVIFLAVSQICPAQNSPSALAIAITAPKTCVKRGSPMELRIVLTNRSDHDVSYRVVAMSGWSGFAGMSVQDPAGKLLPDRGTPHDGSVFSGKEILGAAKSIEKIVDVSKEYDLNKPGKYTIEVWPLNPERVGRDRVIVCVTE